MKSKNILFVPMLILTLLINVSMVSATLKEDCLETVIYEAKEITNESVLLERMEKGITEDVDFKADCFLLCETYTELDGKTYKLNVESVKVTSQKTKEILRTNGDSMGEYTANILSTVSASQ